MTIQNINVYSRQALVSLLGQVISGYPDPENPQPPGPWDPHIRRALQSVQLVFGPHPEPWVQVALNPQPLPPRTLFFTAVAIRGDQETFPSSRQFTDWREDIMGCPPATLYPALAAR